MNTLRGLVPALLIVLVAALAPAAGAQTPPPPLPPGTFPLGIEVTKYDPATRTIEGVKHCTSPDQAGRPGAFRLAEGIDLGDVPPHALIGALVDGSTTPPTVVQLGPPPCNVAPGPVPPPAPGGDFGGAPLPFPGQPGPGQPGPGRPGPGQPGPGGQCPAAGDSAPDADEDDVQAQSASADQPACGPGAPPAFERGFLNRVWKFVGEIDGYDEGVLSITVAKILNLPKRFRDQDDSLVDEDARVLVAAGVRVVKDGKRVGRAELADAENVRVHGKLLKPSKWQKDEDGERTPTIRAKKIHILD